MTEPAFQPFRRIFTRGATKKERTIRAGLLASWLLCVVADYSTMFLFHLSCFGALCLSLWCVHQFFFLKLLGILKRSALQQPASPTTPMVRDTTNQPTAATRFEAHAIITVVWILLRLAVFSVTNATESGGSVATAMVSVLVVIGGVRLFLCSLNRDIKSSLQTVEAWMVIGAIVYWITALTIRAMHAMDLSAITQTLLPLGVLVYAVKRTSLRSTLFPISFLVVVLPFVALNTFFFGWLFMASTNPSWAIVSSNTKLELLQKLGVSNSDILDPTEICTVEEARNIPESSFPLIFKPNFCTTANKGVRPIFNSSDAVDYLENIKYPGRHRGGSCFTLSQRFVPSKKEFVVYYVRYPYMSNGFIKSIGERADPRKVEKDHIAETKYYNQAFFGHYLFSAIRPDLESTKLYNLANHISNTFPGGWHQGRIDIKVAKDEDIANTENLGILEINLNNAADITEKRNRVHLDPSIVMYQTGILGFAMPLRQLRSFFLSLYIGLLNVLMGKISPTMAMAGLPSLIGRAELCGVQKIEHMMGRE